MRLGSTEASPRTITLTATTTVDADAIKTSVSTVTATVSYTGNALNGASVNASYVAIPAPSGHTNVAQYPSVTSIAATGAYSAGSKVYFIGRYGETESYGSLVTRVATLVGTVGGATYTADGPLNSCTTITVDPQTTTGGTFTFGWNDVACPRRGGCLEPFRQLEPTATGVVVITCGSGDDDTMSVTAGDSNKVVDITRVKFSSATTTVATVRLYE